MDRAVAAEIKAQKNAAKKAAAAPDKDKFKVFAARIASLQLPSVDSPEAQEIHAEITEKIASFSRWIEKQADKL